MLAAAACENQRLRLFHEGKTIDGSYGSGLGAHPRPKVVDMSVFWQVPQYLLIGLSEVGHRFPQHIGPLSVSSADRHFSHLAQGMISAFFRQTDRINLYEWLGPCLWEAMLAANAIDSPSASSLACCGNCARDELTKMIVAVKGFSGAGWQ